MLTTFTVNAYNSPFNHSWEKQVSSASLVPRHKTTYSYSSSYHFPRSRWNLLTIIGGRVKDKFGNFTSKNESPFKKYPAISFMKPCTGFNCQVPLSFEYPKKRGVTCTAVDIPGEGGGGGALGYLGGGGGAYVRYQN